MAKKPLLLGLIGHGTTGSDGIERGIHLRWQFLPEMGFPLGAFRVYRRPSANGPASSCFDFMKAVLGKPPEYLARPPSDDRLYLDKPTAAIRVAERPTSQPPYPPKDREFLPDSPTGALPPVIKVLEIPSGGLRLRLPGPCHQVSLHVELQAFGRLTCRAFTRGEEVASTLATSVVASIRAVTVGSPLIEEVEIRASRAALIEVCVRSVESCNVEVGWVSVGNPICLPVYYPKSPCRGGESPASDELEVRNRLPTDPKERRKFEGQVTKDLVESMRVLVEPDPELSQSERVLPGRATADDCAAPNEPDPEVGMSVVDTLLTAALDPAVARILGLYYIDDPGNGEYDYKVVGNWPPGTLWGLPQSLTFDQMRLGRRLLNWFPIGPLAFLARSRPSVIDRPNAKLRTQRALEFQETQRPDWNLPFANSNPAEAVRIVFPEPVGEVQVYVGQASANVELQAFGDAGPISGRVKATGKNEVLAIHGDAPDDRIRVVVLSGSRFWIYRIAWGPDRIAHGTHCGFAYGLSLRDAPRPGKPSGVEAHALPGLVQKVADCEPPLTGATKDARCNAGVDWPVPEDRGAPAGDVPVRYDVIRVSADGQETLATADGPVLASLPPDDEPLEPYVPPPGWPPAPPRLIDSAIDLGDYRYRVVGIDIFGRRSDPSDPSAPVTLKPPASPAPTNVEARFIERANPRLEDRDRAVLPDGVDEAVRIQWLWSAAAERAAPDAAGFRVYHAPGVPNVLEGKVELVTPAGVLANVTVLFEGLGAAQAQLLAGRQLSQGHQAFRILSHPAGTVVGTAVRVVVAVRLPPAPSTSWPVAGPCTLALEAFVPIEVRSLQIVNDEVLVSLRTTALSAEPVSGLAGAELRVQAQRLRLTTKDSAVFDVAQSEWQSRCSLSPETNVDELLEVVLPAFVTLQLPPPPTAAYRDYKSAAGWPSKLNTLFPRTTAGSFALVIRRPAAGESTGLSQPVPGQYLLLVNALPAGLDVNKDMLRRQMSFGVSCVGPADLESAVGGPAVLTRIYRASDAELAAAANLPVTLPAPGAHLYATPPNFAGKSTFPFSWPSQLGYRYEVYRALDETLFVVDSQVRKLVGAGGRLTTAEQRREFLENYDDALEPVIENLIVDPAELDRAAIEAHQNVDTLLQALASLPMNDRAFTRLSVDKTLVRVEVNGGIETCTDGSIAGQAGGRYFYRTRAIDLLGTTSPLSASTPPIYLRTPRPRAPVITKVTSGDRKITLAWASNRETNFVEYRIYRTDSLAVARGGRLTTKVGTVAADPDPSARPASVEWPDDPVQGLVDYYYRVVAVNSPDPVDPSGGGNVSRPSPVARVRAYDQTTPEPPQFTDFDWIRIDPQGTAHAWSEVPPVDETWEVAVRLIWGTAPPDSRMLLVESKSDSQDGFSPASGWLAPGTTSFIHRISNTWEGNAYRLKVLSATGNANVVFHTSRLPAIS